MLKKIFGFLHQYISFRSLRARIFFMILLVGILPSILMRQGIVRNYEERAVEQRTQTVQAQLKIVADHLINEDYLNTPSSKVISAELDMLSNLYDGRVLIINGNFKIIKDTYGISEGKTIISEEVVKCFLGESVAKYDAENGYIEMTTPIVDDIRTDTGGTTDNTGGTSGTGNVKGVMLTSMSNQYIVGTMEVLNRKAMILETIMIIIIVGIAFVLSAILTKPFERVTKAINEVKAGYTNEPISVPDLAETEHIVEAFNQLLQRMKVLDDSRQEFVSNVSHELKTPLTSMKVLADSLLMQENVPAELYHEFLVDIADEIDRENKIINDLLSLVKLDKTQADLNITQVDVNAMLELI